MVSRLSWVVISWWLNGNLISGLTRMGNCLGSTIKVDLTMIQAACVCVEIDLNKSLIEKIQILDHTQLVKYEGLYLVCFDYRRHGHKN